MKKKLFSIITILASCFIANAQLVSNYAFTQSTGTYNAITGGTTIVAATANTGSGSMDDDIYNVPTGSFPFTFTFNGTGYTGCNISTNGFITFGAISPSNSEYTPISGTDSYNGAISAFGGDLNSMFSLGTASVTGSIIVDVTGVSPNRELVIQYTNWRPSYNTSATQAYALNFQIRLQETTNNIYIVYGPNSYILGSTNISSSREIGLRGATSSDYNNRRSLTATSFTASALGTSNSSTQSFSTTGTTPGMPVNGLTYKYAPPVPCSSAPVAGTVVASNTLFCTSANVNLSLTGTTSGVTGLSYQWLSSSDGVTFAPISTATTNATTQSVTATTYYQAAVSCGTNAATSSTVMVSFGTMPNAGTTVASFTTACPNQAINLSLLGASTTTGLKYQWQSSVNGVTYTPIVPTASLSTTTQTVTTDLYFQNVLTCGTSTAVSTPIQVMVAGTTTNTVPYFEGFEGITANNQLPNCSWMASNLPTICKTYTAATGSNNQFAKTGTKFGSFRWGTNSLGDYFYSNGIQLTAGVIYQASADYITDGANGWSEFRLLYGPSQSTASLTSIASATGALKNTTYSNLLGTFSVSTSGLYYVAVKAIGNSTPNYLTFDDLKVNVAPSCIAPTALSTSNMTSSGATFSWTAGATETAWDIYYGTSPLTVPTATTAPTATSSATSYTASSLTPSTGYDVYVRANCGGSKSAWTIVSSFMTACLAPNLVSTMGGTRCGIGTTTLTATAAPGVTLTWYANATGGSSIATGSVLTTPVINANVSYYVTATGGSSTENAGRATAASATGFLTTPDWGIVFNTTKNVLVNSATIYPVGTGDVTIALLDASGTELAATSAITVTGTGVNTPVVVNLGFNVPIGNNYKIVLKSYNGITDLIRDGGSTYPYTSPSGAVSVTGGWTGTGSSTSNYWFYNLSITSGCESARTMVTATVTAPPALSVTTGTTVCLNTIKTLSITSTVSNYDSYIWSPTTNLYTDASGSIAYTGANTSTVNYSSPVNNTSTYMISATNSVSGCANNISVVMGASIPSIVATANPTIVCLGNPVTLNAIGLAPGSGTIQIGTTSNLTSATEDVTAFNNRRASYKMQTVYTAAELTAQGLSSGNITSIAYGITTIGDAATNALYTVKMGTTAVNAFTDFVSNASFSTVFNPATFTHSVGLNTINFNTPYNWDGVSNIVIEVTHNGVDNINNAQTYYTPTVSNMFVYSYDGNATGTLSTKRLSIVMGGQKNVDQTSSYTWVWNPGATPTNTVVFTPTVTGAQSYTVTALDPATTCTNSAVVTFTVNTPPTLSVTASSASVCAGSTATLTATGATNYTWTAAGTSSTQVVIVSSPSTYTVTGEMSGCTNTATVSVGLKTTPTVTATASKTLVCSNSNESSVLTGVASSGTYSWSTTQTTAVITVTPSVGTTYTLTATDNGCSASTTIFVNAQVCTGINNLLVSNDISVYPNPSNGILNIAISGSLSGETSIEMYDAIGKLVITQVLTTETTTINTSKLTDGMYMYKILNNNKAIKIGKIVKQ